MKIKIERNFKKFRNFQFVLPIEDLATAADETNSLATNKQRRGQHDGHDHVARYHCG